MSDESEYMSIDPAYSQSSSSSSSGGMSSEEGDQPYHSEEDLMSIAPEDREPNMTMADGSQGYSNGYSSGYSQEEAALCSYEYAGSDTENTSCGDDFYAGYSSGGSSSSYPMSSYISDIPTVPHVVLESDSLMSGELPSLEVIGIDAAGKQDAFDIKIQPGETAYIHWQALNASRVEVDDQPVDLNASMAINYQESLAGSFKLIEIRAWNDISEYPVTHYIQCNMAHLIGFAYSLKHTIDIPKKPREKKFRYFSFTPAGSLSFNGDYVFREGVVVFKGGKEIGKDGQNPSVTFNDHDDSVEFSNSTVVIKEGGSTKTVGAKEIGYSFQNKFKHGKWDAEPAFDLKVVRKDPNMRNVAQIELSASGGITYTYHFTMPEGQKLSFAIQFTITAFEISSNANDVGKTEWKIDIFKAEAKGSLTYSGELKNDWGTFTGTAKGEVKCAIEPNWSAIIWDLTKTYGPRLLVRASAFLSAPATIAAVTVGGLLYGVHQIIVVNEPSRFRKESLKGYLDSVTKGVEDGLSGVDSFTQSITIVDEGTAYQAGLAAGTLRKMELEDVGDYFEDKDPDLQAELMREVRKAAAENMKLQLWIGKAIELKKDDWFDSQSSDLYMQMSWWNNIIGNSPASKGGEHLTAWELYRVDEPEEDYYSGNW